MREKDYVFSRRIRQRLKHREFYLKFRESIDALRYYLHNYKHKSILSANPIYVLGETK